MRVAFLTELSDHQANRCPAQEGNCVLVQTLPIIEQTTASAEPADGGCSNAPLGHHDELALVGLLDDTDVDLTIDAPQRMLEFWPPIAGIDVEFEQEWEQAEQHAHQQHAGVTVLHVGGPNDGAQQQALRAYHHLAVLPPERTAR